MVLPPIATWCRVTAALSVASVTLSCGPLPYATGSNKGWSCSAARTGWIAGSSLVGVWAMAALLSVRVDQLVAEAVSASASACPRGVPRPVQAFQPGPAS